MTDIGFCLLADANMWLPILTDHQIFTELMKVDVRQTVHIAPSSQRQTQYEPSTLHYTLHDQRQTLRMTEH